MWVGEGGGGGCAASSVEGHPPRRKGFDVVMTGPPQPSLPTSQTPLARYACGAYHCCRHCRCHATAAAAAAAAERYK